MYARIMQVLPHVGLGGVFTYAAYDILSTSRYVKSMSHKTGDTETALDEDTSSLIQRVMEKLNLDSAIRDKYTFFVSTENDPITKGHSNWRTGAVIGLPFYFRFKSVDDVKESQLVVHNEPVRVDWDNEEGQKLANALVLSDAAKSFVIARDVNMLHMFFSHMEVFLRAAFVVLGYTAMGMFDRRLFSQKKMPNWSRYTAVTLVGASVLTIYMATADTYKCSKDMRADRRTAELSKEIAAGGVEYYEKVLARNQVVRELMGPRGDKMFTTDGNNVRGLRTPHIPFSARLTYMKSCLENYEELKRHAQ